MRAETPSIEGGDSGDRVRRARARRPARKSDERGHAEGTRSERSICTTLPCSACGHRAERTPRAGAAQRAERRPMPERNASRIGTYQACTSEMSGSFVLYQGSSVRFLRDERADARRARGARRCMWRPGPPHRGRAHLNVARRSAIAKSRGARGVRADVFGRNVRGRATRWRERERRRTLAPRGSRARAERRMRRHRPGAYGRC